MEQEKTDLRVIRTRKAIREAFCSMIMEMDYPDITIKELTRRAMINRNTFYLHYDSMDALLRELQDEIAGEFIEKQVSYTKMADIRRMIRVFFEYMATQSPLQDRLLCSGSYQILLRPHQPAGDGAPEADEPRGLRHGRGVRKHHLSPTTAASRPFSTASGWRTARSSRWKR